MRRRESLTLDMTPLVDVVFLLLIFFLVTSVFKKDELALLLDLPKVKEGEKVSSSKKVLQIELSQDAIALNGEVVTFQVLEERVSQVMDHNRPVTLRIDASVRYDRVAKLLALLRKYQLSNLSLIQKTLQ
ncbi:MAG: biopolymer transporter ExbD [Hydrogenimonas sp.]|nr:MAG: biopolymer transporter ExbD [Hydrogenimonas sp.]